MKRGNLNGAALSLLSVLIQLPSLAMGAGVAQKPSCDAGMGLGCGTADSSRPSSPGKVPRPDAGPKSSYNGPGLGRGVMESSNDISSASGISAGGQSGTYLADSDVLSEVRNRMESCMQKNQGSLSAARGTSRLISNPQLDATQCISIDPEQKGFGGFINSCDYQVQFNFCAYRPKKDAWTEAFDCEKTNGGAELAQPQQRIAAHTNHAETIHWVGCRFPEGSPVDVKFVPAQGLMFRCQSWDTGDGPRLKHLTSYEVCDASTIKDEILKRKNDEASSLTKARAAKEQARRDEAERERLAQEAEAAEAAAAAEAARRQALVKPPTTTSPRLPVTPPRERTKARCDAERQRLLDAAMQRGQDISIAWPEMSQEKEHRPFLLEVNNRNGCTPASCENVSKEKRIAILQSYLSLVRVERQHTDPYDPPSARYRDWLICKAQAEIAYLQD